MTHASVPLLVIAAVVFAALMLGVPRSRARLRRLTVSPVCPAAATGVRPAETDPALVVDLLGACLRGGLPVATAVDAVAAGTGGPVADVLRRTANALAVGADAETAWSHADGHPDTADLARAARRTASSGSALATQAFALADRVRRAEADRVEARAQRAGVLVAGPLGLCFLPAFLCLGVIPVVLGLADRLAVTP
ncbi:type II secretion system F family protein [Saccharomonospora piscinae]|uniref:type II secretion system F family protein n=1 Tax=Saccharomonospora piscinae TaxID=687388 RepID=UPI001FD9822F|nr:type II secretion system F family protein [Saccharomonospora piscinae]